MTIDWVKKCSIKYFELTGTSPEQSFWSFCDSAGIDADMESFKKLYKELDDYFPKEEKK